MLDVMFGDPLLDEWEHRFVLSCSRQGWHKDYSLKQRVIIEKIFNAQSQKYLKARI